GLNYHYGLFRQSFSDMKQTEQPDPWLSDDRSWLTDTGISFPVKFADFSLNAKMYDIGVPGYHNGISNALHLFDIEEPAEAPENGISFDKSDIRHHLTSFLYPDDSDQAGHLLRIYQQYFMVSAAAQLILYELEQRGFKPQELAERTVVHINDTHPSMIIPELIRLLTLRGIEIDHAIDIVSRTCAYTNHTILAEALEKWPVSYIEQVAPQLVPIIRDLNARAAAKCPQSELAIIDDQDLIHMAHMDIHFGFSVNGVAALHTDILKESELRRFYEAYPDKFNNKTNGITFRRWLMSCNQALADLVTQYIGEEWKKDAAKLADLLDYCKDDNLLDELVAVKHKNKLALADWLSRRGHDDINPDSIFDIQIKRLHQYKRQQMNALYAIWKYLQIKKGNLPQRPITLIFGAKAAPAYTLAKDTIHLILCLSDLFKNDPEVSPWLRIVMVENYNVAAAMQLIPACDLSEQISLASKEASGTGNMKLMANGAVTLGTMDGANVEIAELVGQDNIYIFGRSSDDVIEMYRTNEYNSSDFWQDDEVGSLVDFIISPQLLKLGDPSSLSRLYKDFIAKDYFMALLDLKEYIRVKETSLADYENTKVWASKMLVNIAKSGFFSSDRTISEYNRDIWHLN
ncbi:MAG: glycogen/starch/alpha-glucan phosphorylase, partial [Clostridiaceae bacterium]|nr:glycogen/starch/alpha-glucan phosphorylase [Clostridiaceae bacterium]